MTERQPLSPVGEGAAGQAMLVVHVDVAVVDGRVDEFLVATVANATASLTEPGVVRFDVVTDSSDPAHVVLVEVYRDSSASAAHKQTSHYATWRDTVAEMMARPRTSVSFTPAFPIDASGWESAG